MPQPARPQSTDGTRSRYDLLNSNPIFAKVRVSAVFLDLFAKLAAE
ncbi:MAG: hypothetical protein U0640_00385 [Phycisphaerales bacterium]